MKERGMKERGMMHVMVLCARKKRGERGKGREEEKKKRRKFEIN